MSDFTIKANNSKNSTTIIDTIIPFFLHLWKAKEPLTEEDIDEIKVEITKFIIKEQPSLTSLIRALTIVWRIKSISHPLSSINHKIDVLKMIKNIILKTVKHGPTREEVDHVSLLLIKLSKN